jgi:CRISPR-associated protein Csx17
MRGPLGSEWVHFRSHIEPVALGAKGDSRWVSWIENDSRDVVWHEGRLKDVVNAIMARRLIRAGEKFADSSPVSASISDLADFIERRTDDRLLADLLWGLCLIDYGGADIAQHRPRGAETWNEPPALYSLLKLCFASRNILDVEIPPVPAIHRLAAAGRGREASEYAARRLRASGLAPLIDKIETQGDLARRTAAALLFPIGNPEFLARRILHSPNEQPQLINT